MVPSRKIWAFGSGKGGTGKSLISANIGVYLAQVGIRVAMVDADLGGANLHTCLGLEMPERNLADFIFRREPDLRALQAPTALPNLHLIAGTQYGAESSTIRYQQQRRLLRAVNRLDADLVILDIGAGCSTATMDFFLAAESGVLIVSPEPSAVENAFQLLRQLLFRKMRHLREYQEFRVALNGLWESTRAQSQRTTKDFFQVVEETSPEFAQKLRVHLRAFRPGLVINQARAEEDRELGRALKSIGRRHFGVETDFLGAVEYDDCVWQSVRQRRPLLLAYPHSRPARSIRQIADNLLYRMRQRSGEVRPRP